MTRISPQAIRYTIFAAIAVVSAMYIAAWLAPAIGLYHDDGAYLVTAKAISSGHGYLVDSLPTPVPQTAFPPLFPVLLALFAAISSNAQWLKALPLACTAGWLVLSWKLLRRLGASPGGTALVVLLAAASPAVIFLGTNLMPESLFGLLVVAAMLALLDDRHRLAGILAGLATLTRAGGLPLVAACALMLLLYGRLRKAVEFTAAAMLLAAPWFGWSMAHSPSQNYYGRAMHASTSILTSLEANEKLFALGNNFLYLFSALWSMLSGVRDVWAVLVTLGLLGWSLWRRRQLVPDLFLALYSLLLLFALGPVENALAPVLPLIIWIFWRGLGNVVRSEAILALVLLLLGGTARLDFERFRMLSAGQFPTTSRQPNDWREMERLFAFIRTNTPENSVFAANLDPVIYLNTGRKTIRGFAPDYFRAVYQPGGVTVTPDGLSSAVLAENCNFVVLTPDRDFVESPAYRRSVEAMERGGVLEPVPVPGLAAGYRLLRVARNSFRR